MSAIARPLAIRAESLVRDFAEGFGAAQVAMRINEPFKIIQIKKDEGDFRRFRARSLEQAIEIAMEVAGVVKPRNVIGYGELHDAVMLLFKIE